MTRLDAALCCVPMRFELGVNMDINTEVKFEQKL
jgi:hypothetical protein